MTMSPVSDLTHTVYNVMLARLAGRDLPHHDDAWDDALRNFYRYGGTAEEADELIDAACDLASFHYNNR